MRQPTDDELRETFDYLIRRAAFFGEYTESSCIGVDRETWIALKRVADERSAESVTAARIELERQMSGLYGLEQEAVWLATRAGEIETHADTRNHLTKHGYPVASAVDAWIDANRKNPGEIYRSAVVDKLGERRHLIPSS